MVEIIPAIIGLLIFVPPTTYMFWLYCLAISSRRWPSVLGKVTESNIQKLHITSFRDGSEYNIYYDYEVNERMFQGSRVCFGGALDKSYANAYATVQKYKERNPKVYYHRRWPSISTLEQRASRSLLFYLLPGLFITGSIIYGIFTE
jgi:hypothetical protein